MYVMPIAPAHFITHNTPEDNPILTKHTILAFF